jgi:hypothetical protein
MPSAEQAIEGPYPPPPKVRDLGVQDAPPFVEAKTGLLKPAATIFVPSAEQATAVHGVVGAVVVIQVAPVFVET